MDPPFDPRQIAIVGPCAAGKTTLAVQLQALGYRARQIVQEHSFVADMWKTLANPDYLIYLDATHETCRSRKSLAFSADDHQEQLRRLRHARQHCDLYIQTDDLTPEQVLQIVERALRGG